MASLSASQLRQRLYTLRGERHRLEEALLEVRQVVRGSLVERYLGSNGHRRRSPAFYVSRKESGRVRLIYVRKVDVDRVRREVKAYQRYRRGLRQLRELDREILAAFKALCSSVEGPVR